MKSVASEFVFHSFDFNARLVKTFGKITEVLIKNHFWYIFEMCDNVSACVIFLCII